MDTKYLLGVIVSILCGIINAVGVIFQKKAVNDLSPESRRRGFMRRLVKNPLWLAGLFLQFVLGAAAFMLAQGLIGPSLVPGLMASGLIVLALGSVKLIGEKLSLSEFLGICLMAAGILLLGLSGMEIPLPCVREALAVSNLQLRMAIFTAALLFGCGIFHLLSRKFSGRKGVVMGFSNGFLFGLSNFWVNPLLAVMGDVLSGAGRSAEVVIFVLACFLLVGSNLAAIRQIQEAFKFGQASNIIPVQQIPIQVSPILVYFYVFKLIPGRSLAGVEIVIGVLLIIVSGFMLGRRQAELERL